MTAKLCYTRPAIDPDFTGAKSTHVAGWVSPVVGAGNRKKLGTTDDITTVESGWVWVRTGMGSRGRCGGLGWVGGWGWGF